MIRFIAIPLIAMACSGCPQADILSGKESPYKAAHETRVALVTLEDPDPVVEPEPAIEPEPVAVIEPPAPPPCVETFRINRCGPDGEELPW